MPRRSRGSARTSASSPVPSTIPDPAGVKTVHVERAEEMRDAVEQLLPADAAIFVAAVADWRTDDSAGQKIKKVAGKGPPALQMVENPDILAGVGHHKKRPYLVVGFAAETQDVLKNAAGQAEEEGRGLHRRQRRQRHESAASWAATATG